MTTNATGLAIPREHLRKRKEIPGGDARTEHAIPQVKRAAVYLKHVEGRKWRLAQELGAHFTSVYEWYRGEHTPSAHHLATLLGLVLDQAEEQAVELDQLKKRLGVV